MLDDEVRKDFGTISHTLGISFLTLNQGPFAPRSFLASTLLTVSLPSASY